MKQQLILAFALSLLALSAMGANLSVSGSSTVMTAGSTGGTMTVGVTSNDPMPPATENLAGWQLDLNIVPDVGATGTVSFSMVFLPSPYLLDGVNQGLNANPINLVLNTVLAFDYDPSGTGVPVPVVPAAGLLNIDFAATAGASGTFGLFAVPGAGNSEWTVSDGLSVRSFVNLPVGAGDIRIGEITVVPEPASLTLALAGLSLLLLRRKR